MIYDTVSKKSNSYQIINNINKNQPFIYSELLKSYPDIDKGDKIGEMGF